jgi:hypothetical protein
MALMLDVNSSVCRQRSVKHGQAKRLKIRDEANLKQGRQRAEAHAKSFLKIAMVKE